MKAVVHKHTKIDVEEVMERCASGLPPESNKHLCVNSETFQRCFYK